MRAVFEVIGHGQGADILNRHRGITGQALMLGRDLSGAVGKAPRRVRHDASKPVFAQKVA
jgi:hypothetical protein